MTLVPCFECKSQIGSIYSLNVHYKYCHPSVKNYTCQLPNCTRKFDSWSSYRKHLTSVHDVPFRDCSEKNLVSEGNDSENSFCVPEEGCFNESQQIKSDFTQSKFKKFLEDAAASLVAKFSSLPGLPRNFVDVLMKSLTLFLSDKFFILLQDFILGIIPDEFKTEVQNAFDLFVDPFHHLSTEHRRFSYFRNSGCYIAPQPYDIHKRPERVITKNGVKQVMKSVQGQFIPVRDVLKKFMELPDVLSKLLDYVKSVESEEMLVSFLQSLVWQRKRAKFGPGAIVFPVHVYYDDYEPNNPLGPHCDKLGAVYLQLSFLPPECQSKINNILLALLFKTEDRVSYEKRAVFKPLIKELKKLEEEGVWVYTAEAEGPLEIFFVTGQLLGDNLGLNGMCGFVERFTANHMCRICKVHRNDMGHLYEEDPSLLRTRENYLEDVNVNDSSKTGIKEKCVFDEIPSFETPTDVSVDCFHDTDEGVSHYVMVPVILHFHRIIPNFVETLNQRLYMIDLGVDNDNHPPSIDVEKLKSNKKLKMTGAEMLTFVRIFGVLVVDLVPLEDSFYQMYLLLHDIVSICHAKVISKECPVILETLVKELDRLYVHLSGENLKPKHHILTHYSRLSYLFGPIGCLSTIRLEAKHRFLKAISSVCVCRKNLPMTVAMKHQLHLCYRFMCDESIVPTPIQGPGQTLDLSDHSFFHSFRRSLPVELSQDSHAFCPRWIDYKGTKYTVKDVIITGFSSETGCPVFSEIEIILPYNDDVYSVCSPLTSLGYYSEVRGYQVERFPEFSRRWFCVKQESLIDFHTLSIIQIGHCESVIILKSFL